MLGRIFFIIFLMMTSLFAEKLQNDMWGFSVNIPKHWTYEQNSEGIFLGHNTIAGMIMLYPHEIKNKQELKALMHQGLDEDDGYLRLEGSLKKYGKRGYMGMYRGLFQMQEVIAKAYGSLSPYGGGAIIIAMSTPQAFSKQLNSAAMAMMKSLRYKKGDTTNLMKKFVGKWTTMTRYSETHIYLFANGTYSNNYSASYGNSDTSVGTTWGGANESQNSGRWCVKGTLKQGKIIMTESNGQRYEYPYHVHVENGQTFWNEYYFGDTLYFK
jgi:hypothetical protein